MPTLLDKLLKVFLHLAEQYILSLLPTIGFPHTGHTLISALFVRTQYYLLQMQIYSYAAFDGNGSVDFKNNSTVLQLPEDAAGMERHRVRLPL